MLGHQLKIERGQEPEFEPKRFRVFNRLILLVACVILVIVLLSHAGSFLVLNAPEHADAILILAGGADNAPYEHAMDLQKQGYANWILLDASVSQGIYGKSEAELATEFLNRTFPGLVEVCPIRRVSTFGEAADVKRCLAGLNASSVLIVTSDFQTRRALDIFRKRLPQYRWSVAAVSAPYNYAEQWWRHRAWAKTVLEEWNEFAWWKLIDQWRADVELR
jgi:uncharacterized SAM-binding protein YcdF (DUF218 family)